MIASWFFEFLLALKPIFRPKLSTMHRHLLAVGMKKRPFIENLVQKRPNFSVRECA